MSNANDIWEKKLEDPGATPMSLPLEFLKSITCDFAMERELGRGGCGVVYKGGLRSGKIIAVKKFFEIHVLDDNKFRNEISYLMGIKHQNVAHFVGYCAESSWERMRLPGSENYIFAEIPKRLLCFEYVCNGSLDKYISDESSGLEWNVRYKIIRGICHGLHYLHEECRIVHLDMKPENILIDATMAPKIADFGLSRIFGEKQSRIITESRAGTRGYMAPEYLIQGLVSIKADIFSLGVIIIEIVTGHRDYPLNVVPYLEHSSENNSSQSTGMSSQHFKEKILHLWRNRLQKSQEDSVIFEQIRVCIELGLQCTEFNPCNRPATQHIIDRLDEVASNVLQQGHAISEVLEREKMSQSFQDITVRLKQVLTDVSFDELDIPDEPREQVALVHARLKRADGGSDSSDHNHFNNLMSVNKSSTSAAGSDPDTLPRLCEKFTLSDLNEESLTLHEMSTEWDPCTIVEKKPVLLTNIKDFVLAQVPAVSIPTFKNDIPMEDHWASLVVPDAFRCPLSLRLMKDPVMIATGQTYERGSIERWLKAGHDTCPTTEQILLNKSLIPNIFLQGLIARWCEANGLEPPECSAEVSNNAQEASCTASEHDKVIELLQKLSSPNLRDRRVAAGTLRLLSKRNAENRACIGDSGGIPILVSLLSTTDVSTQEYVVTALLNVSINDENKARLAGAVHGLVYVLERGSMEARENAAAALLSLSVVDEYRVIIGGSGSIPPLVLLLTTGSQQGKIDAAQALFNLCVYKGNKGRVVRAGLVPILLELLTVSGNGIMDEACAILSILSSSREGKAAISVAAAIPILVAVIRNESPRIKENAAAILLHLCKGEGKQEQQHLAEAQAQGVVSVLEELAENGPDRGKRKATKLLKLMDNSPST